MRETHVFFIALMSLTVTLSAGCMKIPGVVDYIPFRDISSEYSIDDARTDSCVVYENSDITSGQEIWNDFAGKASEGKKTMVRLAFYYDREDTLSEGPRLYINDLFYDGNKYELLSLEEGKETRKTYKYMKRYEGTPSSDTAIFSRYLRYVLVNTDEVTWEDIEHGMFSSQSGDWIDHKTVYVNYDFE